MLGKIKIQKLELTKRQFKFLSIIILLLLYNYSFFTPILEGEFKEFNGFHIAIMFFVLLLIIYYSIISLFGVINFEKYIVIFLFLLSSFAAFFADRYGIIYNEAMIYTIVSTDYYEATGLISNDLIINVFLLGFIPSIFIANIKIIRPKFKDYYKKALIISIVSILALSFIYVNYYSILSVFTSNKSQSQYRMIPLSIIRSSIDEFKDSELFKTKTKFKIVASDAKIKKTKPEAIKPKKVILVIGESARAQNFSLNGYKRDTNPYLKKENLLSFKNFYSCDVGTYRSITCLLSLLERSNFNMDEGHNSENILDIMNKLGINVFWRANNYGGSDNIKRINVESLTNENDAKHCVYKERCFDEILLKNLEFTLREESGDGFVILHQMGSHGPNYHLRYPTEFTKFKPTCKSNTPDKCSKETLLNSYDNSILYTDYFLYKTINILKNLKDDYTTALIYVSDHGQSLGEYGIYFHGLPYLIAPKEQKNVPFILWLSDDMIRAENIDINCIERQKNNQFSHDYIFHTLLSLMDIDTKIYNEELNIFSGCN